MTGSDTQCVEVDLRHAPHKRKNKNLFSSGTLKEVFDLEYLTLITLVPSFHFASVSTDGE